MEESQSGRIHPPHRGGASWFRRTERRTGSSLSGQTVLSRARETGGGEQPQTGVELPLECNERLPSYEGSRSLHSNGSSTPVCGCSPPPVSRALERTVCPESDEPVRRSVRRNHDAPPR